MNHNQAFLHIACSYSFMSRFFSLPSLSQSQPRLLLYISSSRVRAFCPFGIAEVAHLRHAQRRQQWRPLKNNRIYFGDAATTLIRGRRARPNHRLSREYISTLAILCSGVRLRCKVLPCRNGPVRSRRSNVLDPPSLEASNLLRQKVDVGSSSKGHNLEVLRLLLAYIQCLGPDGALEGWTKRAFRRQV